MRVIFITSRTDSMGHPGERRLAQQDHRANDVETTGREPVMIHTARVIRRVEDGFMAPRGQGTVDEGRYLPPHSIIYPKRGFSWTIQREGYLSLRVERIRIVLLEGERGRKFVLIHIHPCEACVGVDDSVQVDRQRNAVGFRLLRAGQWAC